MSEPSSSNKIATPKLDGNKRNKETINPVIIETCASASTSTASAKVYKKSAQNNKITLYLGTRNIYIGPDKQNQTIQGVVHVDPLFLGDKKVFGQVTLTFRYGREDEEVMGLKFCNEAVMCLAQLVPPHDKHHLQPPMGNLTRLQEALLERLGENAYPFTMEVTAVAPPSVTLVPAKEYTGAPIGTSYDIRAFAGNRADEPQLKRNIVRMSIKVMQLQHQAVFPISIPPHVSELPKVVVDKNFFLSEGKLVMEASLDKSVYTQQEKILVNLTIRNHSKKQVKRIKILIIQYVDVCMFSNGKFKNVVATLEPKEGYPLKSGEVLSQQHILIPEKGATKNWIALEDSNNPLNAPLAPTVNCTSSDDRNVFAIYVSYYVKIKAIVGAINTKMSMKLPFTLAHAECDTTYSDMSCVAEDNSQNIEPKVM